MLEQLQELTRKQISKNTNENQISTNVNNVSKLYRNDHETKKRWNKTITYEQITDKKVETSYVNIDIIQKLKNFNEHYVVIYHSFQIEIDLVFVEYLFNTRVTKRVVNNVFDDFKLKSLWQHAFFKNDKEWLNKLERMKIEILDDEWFEEKLKTIVNARDIAINKYKLYHKNIIKMIKFLMKFKRFVNNLTYVSKRRYITHSLNEFDVTIDDEKIWTKMHIDDW